MGKEHGNIVENEDPLQATVLTMATPADSDMLAALVIDKNDATKFRYVKLSVEGIETARGKNRIQHQVHIMVLPLRETFVEGPLDVAIQNLIETEASIGESDNPSLKSLRGAVGTIEYTGSAPLPLELTLQLAGIHYHRERENYKILHPLNA